MYYHWQTIWGGSWSVGREASPLPPPVDRTLHVHVIKAQH